MKKEYLLAVFTLLVLILPLTSSYITFAESKQLYNIGDQVDLTVQMTFPAEKNDFLTAELNCDGDDIQIYRNAVYVKADEKKEVVISAIMDNFLIGNISGTCFLSANYAGENRNSQSFKLSRHAEVKYNSLKKDYNPGESLNLTGTVVKENGDALSGLISFSFGGNGSITGEVRNGSFQLKVVIPEDQSAGEYKTKLVAQQLDAQSQILNSGESEFLFSINQIVKKIDIAIISPNITVGNEFIYTPLVFDQTGNKMEKPISIKVFSDNKTASSFNSSSGKVQNITINSNYTPGTWYVGVKTGELAVKKSFSIEKLEKADFLVQNDTLAVKNLGNVPFVKQIKVLIGDKPKLIDVNLGVGNSEKYKLTAPKGYYPIALEENGNITALGTSFLTGHAIGISELALFNGGYIGIFFWIIIILLIAVVVVYYYKKIKNKKYYGYAPTKFLKPISLTPRLKGNTEESVIQKGEKQECAVISLKIKNYAEIENSTSNAVEAIENAVSRARNSQAKVIRDGANWLAIFAPVLTKNAEGALTAVKVAQEIETILNEHNQKFSQKIKFGIGLNSGELIVETGNDTFNFASVGTTITSAKRVADVANNQALLSDSIRKKTLSNVKVEKYSEGTWKISRFVDRGKNTEFLDRFTKRNQAK